MGSVLRSLRDKNSIFIDEYFMGERRINESKCRECRRWRDVLCFWRKYLQVSFKSQRTAYRLWLHRSLICSCRRTLHSYIIKDLLKAARRKPTPSRKAASSKRRDSVFLALFGFVSGLSHLILVRCWGIYQPLVMPILTFKLN